MNKLVEATLNIVRNMGESLFVDLSKPYAYTLVAKFGNQKFLMRIASDAENISTSAVRDLKILSAYTDAISICIVSSVRGQILQRGTVYLRDNVKFISLSTFADALRGKGPVFKFNRGMFTAVIDGENLRRKREERGMSLGVLADRLGVTRETVYRYERGEIETPLRVAQKLIEMFGEDVVRKFDINEKPAINQDEIRNREIVRNTYRLLESHPDAIRASDRTLLVSRNKDRREYEKTVELANALNVEVESL